MHQTLFAPHQENEGQIYAESVEVNGIIFEQPYLALWIKTAHLLEQMGNFELTNCFARYSPTNACKDKSFAQAEYALFNQSSCRKTKMKIDNEIKRINAKFPTRMLDTANSIVLADINYE